MVRTIALQISFDEVSFCVHPFSGVYFDLPKMSTKSIHVTRASADDSFIYFHNECFRREIEEKSIW